MKTLLTFALVLGTLTAADVPQPAAPTAEHKWLEPLAGEWAIEAECFTEPGKPGTKSKGIESSRMLGKYWLVTEIKGEFQGVAVNGIMTIGYDADKKQYVGTWVDNMQNHLWHYTGQVSKDGKTLTLDADGPDMTKPGKTTKYQDVITITGKGTKEWSSSMLVDGKWVKIMSSTGTKK